MLYGTESPWWNLCIVLRYIDTEQKSPKGSNSHIYILQCIVISYLYTPMTNVQKLGF